MKYFFDNCLPLRLARALVALGVECTHLRDRFPGGDIEDVDWMPLVAGEGFVAVTGDDRISRRPAEREARRLCGLRTVFFASLSDLPFWTQVTLIIRVWPEIESWAKKAPAGQCARVTQRGKFEVLKSV